MTQQELFLERLNQSFSTYRCYKENNSNTLLREKEGFDFDLDATFAEWAKSNNVDYLIVDVATATRDDIDAIVAHWDHPTAYLFKNYGDESAGNYRNKISIFIKDRYLGIRCSGDPEPQVVLCFVTELKDKPINDFWERQVFYAQVDF